MEIRIPVLIPDAPLAMRLSAVLFTYFLIRLIIAVYLLVRRLIQG